jgi:polysaccharide biosynthesis protein PslJ
MRRVTRPAAVGATGSTRESRRSTAAASSPEILLGLGLVVACGIAVGSDHLLVLVGAAVATVAVALMLRVQTDVAGGFVVMLSVLLVMPARLRIAPLHALGTPGALVGLVAFAAYVWGRTFGRNWLARGRQPLRFAWALVVLSSFVSYVAFGYRSHTFAESKAADRGLMLLAGMIGLSLLLADGITTRARLRRVLQAIVGGGVVVAALGIVQFATGTDFASRIRVPGFTYVVSDAGDRAGFTRIVSTATHPIELSVILVLVLIIALHLVFTSAPETRRRYVAAACIVGAAVPLTVSRTGIIALAAGMFVLFLAWDSRRRANMIGVLALGILATRALVPGLVGTLASFFTDSSQDPSRLSRQSGLDYAFTLIGQRPLFGRGLGTFIPEQYVYLDNQVALTTVETGVVGLLVLFGVFAVASWQTRDVRRVSQDPADRDLAQTLLACIVVGVLTSFTYDAFSFPTGESLLMVCVGLSGALWRIARTEEVMPIRQVTRLSARRFRGLVDAR